MFTCEKCKSNRHDSDRFEIAIFMSDKEGGGTARFDVCEDCANYIYRWLEGSSDDKKTD